MKLKSEGGVIKRSLLLTRRSLGRYIPEPAATPYQHTKLELHNYLKKAVRAAAVGESQEYQSRFFQFQKS